MWTNITTETAEPQPGDVWNFATLGFVSAEVFVQKRSRFWSWFYGRPYYWVTSAGNRLSWLESAADFLCRVYPGETR